MTRQKRDIRKEITNQIIHLIKDHGADWTKPFAALSGAPRNALTGHRYQGGNSLWLGLQGQTYWATFKQWKELGASVVSGKNSATYISRPVIIKNKETGEVDALFFNPVPVFSAAQVEGWEPPENLGVTDSTESVAKADAFIEGTGADIRYSDEDRAYFSPAGDFIHLPHRKYFHATNHSSSTVNFYSTILHELTHWSGGKSRLDRNRGAKFGDRDYGFEELVAEIGSCYLSAELSVSSEGVRPDHIQYISGWLKALNNDSGFIFDAAKKAQEAVVYLESLQPESLEEAA